MGSFTDTEGLPDAGELKTPYHCQHCSYESKFWSRMINHSMIHQGSLFSCSYCSFSSPRLSALKTHQYFQHVGRGTVRCGVCGFKALNSYLMQKHIDKWHVSGNNEDSLAQTPTSHSRSITTKSNGKEVVNSGSRFASSILKSPEIEICSEDEADLSFGNPRKKTSGGNNESSKLKKPTATETTVKDTLHNFDVLKSTWKFRARKVDFDAMNDNFDSIITRKYAFRSSTTAQSRKKLFDRLIDQSEDDDDALSTMTC